MSYFIRNYSILGLLNEAEEETAPAEASKQESPTEQSGGDDLDSVMGAADSGSDPSSSPVSNNRNELKAENKKKEEAVKKIINIVIYYCSVILKQNTYMVLNNRTQKFLSKSIIHIKEILKNKTNSVFKKYIRDGIIDTDIIQSIIDSFDIIRESSEEGIDKVYMLFNRKKAVSFLFTKHNGYYKLHKIDFEGSYTKKMIQNDIFKFTVDLVNNKNKKEK